MAKSKSPKIAANKSSRTTSNDVSKNIAGQNPHSNSGEVDTKEYQASAIDDAPPDVARLAYEKFLARGCVDGHDLEDWLAAEREVQTRRGGDHSQSAQN